MSVICNVSLLRLWRGRHSLLSFVVHSKFLIIQSAVCDDSLFHCKLLSVFDVDALGQRVAVDALSLEVVYGVVGSVVVAHND